jgi:hypothetical protein
MESPEPGASWALVFVKERRMIEVNKFGQRVGKNLVCAGGQKYYLEDGHECHVTRRKAKSLKSAKNLKTYNENK